ncbi:MAG TPA: adenylate/guanylate cyclase domain-containing protein [Candidatus Dormibacteraeota bacterium]|nr:adenylate/guanylate cyclase domain-containing protein [Candidatus Dormibacteraeota bacterium]
MTALFADIAGSTSFGASEDPEEVRDLMGRYYGTARDVITAHGGTVEKFIGDAVMAVFGLPRAHGDDAVRAIAAAIALRDRLRSDADLARLRLRFGLATGEVFGSRETDRGDFLATGDAVNVAARLQQAAAPDEIVATDRTAWDARSTFEFGPARQVDIQGRGEPVIVRTLIGPGKGRLGQSPLPFVGRVDELDQLRLTARRSFRDRIPAVVSIVAPAGTGKTRLVEEFLDVALPELVSNARVETAQCLPYGAQLTYWPLRSVLFSLAGIGAESSQLPVVEAVQRWLGDRRDAELLAATVGAESATPSDPTELFAAWRSALARAAADNPLVIVFEDLHWSSDSLLDLVEFVMDPREAVPILMIAIARPELIDRRPAWGGGRRNFVSIYLDPLPEADIAALIGPLLEGVPVDTVREVARRSEGNPFFAGELAQAVLERAGEALPDTVQATVLARLDLLNEGERRLLQVASVFGRSFRPEGLRAIAPEVGDRESDLIDELMARDMLRRQDAEHLAFRHILIRDVAYSTLPRAERSRLHAAAGDWFESRAGGREEEVAEIVALHFREAMYSAGSRSPVAADLRRKAGRWLLRAGEMAASAAASREAEAHFRAALECFDDPDEAAAIWARLGEVLRLYPSGFEAYKHAYALARDPTRRLASIAGLLLSGMRYARTNFSEEEVEAAIDEGDALLQAVKDTALEARFLAGVGFQTNWALARGLRLADATARRAERSATRGAELAQSLGAPDLVSVCLDSVGSCAMYRLDWQAVREHAETRRAFGERLSLPEIMDADHVVCWSSSVLGDPHRVDRTNREAAARLRPGQLPEWRLSILCWRLRVEYTLGEWAEATDTIDQALAAWRSLGSPGMGWVRVGFRPGLLIARGRRDAARSNAMAGAFRAANSATPPVPYDIALVDDDLDGLARSVFGSAGYGFGAPIMADALRQLVDAERDSIDVIESIPPAHRRLPVVAPHVARALGMAARDVDQLRAALDLARTASDVPLIARLCLEVGRLANEPSLVAEGHDALVKMGDLVQLERYGL